jgi:riboflavin biosynthesis pyrimidine reductase
VIVTGAEKEGVAHGSAKHLRAPAPEGGPGRVDLAAALARLRSDLGVRSVLCEGGPHLNAELLRAGLVDELFLSLAPKLLGGADALTIVAGAALPEPLGLTPVWLLEHEGELFLRLRVEAAEDLLRR